MREAETLFGEAHVQRYGETDGEVGHIWRRGAKTLLLTTTGRKTGNPATTPLIYAPQPALGQSTPGPQYLAPVSGSVMTPSRRRILKDSPTRGAGCAAVKALISPMRTAVTVAVAVAS